jgi:acetyltransferase-like isoleucine patch superfamily enzyme
MGQVGTALTEILKDKYPTITKDKNGVIGEVWKRNFKVEVMHICFPHSGSFVKQVIDYYSEFFPSFIVIHSTVPIGTTLEVEAQIDADVYYSPVRGHHVDMTHEMRVYTKYIACNGVEGLEVQIVNDYFRKVGLGTRLILGEEATSLLEFMKILELYRNGAYLAVAKDQETICKEFGMQYEDVVTEWERSSNEGLKKMGKDYLCQPILYPFKDFVGGHCTTEVMEILRSQVTTPLLEECLSIDRGTKIWPNCNIYPGAKIGKGCSIGQFTEVDDGVVIGNSVRIGAFCFIPSGVTIEDGCFVAPKVMFSNDKHPPSNKKHWAKILVKTGAMIGVGSVILPGVTIGRKAVVGAGSVVTKDVPDGEVWYGEAAHKQTTREKVYT